MTSHSSKSTTTLRSWSKAPSSQHSIFSDAILPASSQSGLHCRITPRDLLQPVAIQHPETMQRLSREVAPGSLDVPLELPGYDPVAIHSQFMVTLGNPIPSPPQKHRSINNKMIRNTRVGSQEGVTVHENVVSPVHVSTHTLDWGKRGSPRKEYTPSSPRVTSSSTASSPTHSRPSSTTTSPSFSSSSSSSSSVSSSFSSVTTTSFTTATPSSRPVKRVIPSKRTLNDAVILPKSRDTEGLGSTIIYNNTVESNMGNRNTMDADGNSEHQHNHKPSPKASPSPSSSSFSSPLFSSSASASQAIRPVGGINFDAHYRVIPRPPNRREYLRHPKSPSLHMFLPSDSPLLAPLPSCSVAEAISASAAAASEKKKMMMKADAAASTTATSSSTSFSASSTSTLPSSKDGSLPQRGNPARSGINGGTGTGAGRGLVAHTFLGKLCSIIDRLAAEDEQEEADRRMGLTVSPSRRDTLPPLPLPQQPQPQPQSFNHIHQLQQQQLQQQQQHPCQLDDMNGTNDGDRPLYLSEVSAPAPTSTSTSMKVSGVALDSDLHALLRLASAEHEELQARLIPVKTQRYALD